MSDPRYEQVKSLLDCAAKIQSEIDGDRVLKFKESWLAFEAVYGDMVNEFDGVPQGPSMHDTRTGASYWSRRDEVERVMDRLEDAVLELAECVEKL